MPDAITTLGLMKTVSEVLKDALRLARETKNAELAEKLIDVYGDMVQIMESDHALREEVQELKRQGEIEHELEFNPSNGSYMRITAGRKDGPVCGTCWDVDKKLVQ